MCRFKFDYKQAKTTNIVTVVEPSTSEKVLSFFVYYGLIDVMKRVKSIKQELSTKYSTNAFTFEILAQVPSLLTNGPITQFPF